MVNDSRLDNARFSHALEDGKNSLLGEVLDIHAEGTDIIDADLGIVSKEAESSVEAIEGTNSSMGSFFDSEAERTEIDFRLDSIVKLLNSPARHNKFNVNTEENSAYDEAVSNGKEILANKHMRHQELSTSPDNSKSDLEKEALIEYDESNDRQVQNNCKFTPAPLNTYNQFETDLIEGGVQGLFAVGAIGAGFVPVVGPILSVFVVPLAGSIVAGQLSAAYATDPNEDRFKAIEGFSSCVEKEFEQVWKKLAELTDRMNRSQIQEQKEFFERNIQKLEDQKNVMFTNYIIDINFCLKTDGLKFLNTRSECGTEKIIDVSADIFAHVAINFGGVLSDAAILYKSTGVSNSNSRTQPYFPMFGERKEIEMYLDDTKNNHGFDVTSTKLDYTDMRTFLSEINYQANVIILTLAQLREWATSRQLYLNYAVFSKVWFRVIKTVDDISESLQNMIDSLMYSSAETGNLPNQRIITSDNYNSRVFCIDLLKLKTNAPDWCRNKDPEGWRWNDQSPKDDGDPQCGNEYTRGCWIGDGDCSLENFRQSCVDWFSSDAGTPYYNEICALNGTPSLPVDNKNYPDGGPISWAYSAGAPVDPLLNEINEMRKAVGYAKAFSGYWKREQQILNTVITPHCSGETDVSLGAEYTFKACPKPLSCTSCSSGSGSECSFEKVTDAEKCGSYTVSECCKITQTMEPKFGENEFRCGTEQVKNGETCSGWLW
eukprot:CAMPEP_0172488852 /NCGR_PEP_ID=MMETSP1066-20121228/18560_1 /TAXON_ID=671091 /ORGANISM="Coscinodiscus wailesii, Strain CCMP2513" /LENGTH=715 /DNA_ID=CAMNT_0013256331 /DNA_START=156 /DNA_END=2300 /DNA_ORIENTATION=-